MLQLFYTVQLASDRFSLNEHVLLLYSWACVITLEQ